MKSLAITLGHNSSCAVINNDTGIILAAFEEERLTRKKSDSSFPYLSIGKCAAFLESDLDCIYVSHWFEDGKLAQNKWCDLKFLKDMCDNILSTDQYISHHDAHAWSAIAFAKEHTKDIDGYDVIVCDGFGNNKEVFTHYKYDNGCLVGMNTAFGYDLSLGLLYQYATDYCGMKMNQDEYKFLGYEAKIEDISYNKVNLDIIIRRYIDKLKRMYFTKRISSNSYSFEDLEKCKKTDFFLYLFDVCINCMTEKVTEYNKRVLIGYSIQRIIETFMIEFIQENKIKNVILSGGVFYNVKLNSAIMSQVDKICVMPLAGDIGAGLGLYHAYNDNLVFGDLCYGRRKDFSNTIDAEIKESIIKKIQNNEIINILKGDMEFGPRALCNTSTLALPTQENVEKINMANKRNTIMPMAPVIIREVYKKYFFEEDADKIIGSDKFMIISMKYRSFNVDKFRGVAHNIPESLFYSGRPQVIDEDHELYYIVRACGGILINTSYNMHGKPILYDKLDLEDNSFDTYMIKKQGADICVG